MDLGYKGTRGKCYTCRTEWRYPAWQVRTSLAFPCGGRGVSLARMWESRLEKRCCPQVMSALNFPFFAVWSGGCICFFMAQGMIDGVFFLWFLNREEKRSRCRRVFYRVSVTIS